MMQSTTPDTARPDFGYEVLLAKTFDEILERRGEPVSYSQLLDIAIQRGRLLLQAPGGAGKSFTLGKLGRVAKERGIIVGLVRLASLPPSALDAYGYEALLRAAEPSLPPDALGSGSPMLLLVDGLNEVPRAVTDMALRAIEELASRGPQTGVIVTDRLVRRDVNTTRWRLATLRDVSRSMAESIMERTLSDSDAALMASPVYLESARRAGHTFVRRSDAHLQYFADQLGLSKATIDALGKHALDAYVATQSRYFSISSLIAAGGGEIVSTLIAAGALVDETGTAVDFAQPRESVAYRHHLLHDFLAARGAASSSLAWDASLFNALTFYSASSDILVMLLELIAPDDQDRLVRCVYDWNLYSAAYLLSAWVSGDRLVAPSTEAQVLSLLGERRFDRFVASAQQVSDALRLHGGDYARGLLAATTAEEAVAMASLQLPADDEFQRWLTVFENADRPAPTELYLLMKTDDGVDGWTAANVVRRLGVSESDMHLLLVLASDDIAVVRWRACHALGVAGDLALDTLFEAFASDSENTVRYGALRSIVEQALLCGSVAERAAIFDRLAQHHEELAASSTLSREFARVLHVRDAPEEWSECASVVIAKLLANATDVEAQDQWRAVSSELRRSGGGI